MTNSYRQKTCFLCKSPDITTVLTLTPTPIADEYVPKLLLHKPQATYPLTLLLCKKCGHVQLQDIIRPESIYVDYIFRTTSSKGLVKHFQQYARDVINTFHPKPNSLLVELGSNDGTLLKEFKVLGMRVLGVDPAKKIARVATLAGIETLPVFFTSHVAKKIHKKYGPAAIICANNVVANIDTFEEFIRGVKHLISPNGVFIFESFYLKDLIENKVFDFIFHEHFSYFSVKPLVSFFARHGMKIVDIIHVPTKGGSLRYIVTLAKNSLTPSLSIQKFITDETNVGLHNPRTFHRFSKSILQSKKQLLALLHILKKQQKIIAGFGASATSTTLLYHFDLNDKLPFIIDENPDKLHTFTPGYHIPVYPTRALYTKKPDYVLILAWRYAKSIIANNHMYRSRGGHFIIPLPTLEVV